MKKQIITLTVAALTLSSCGIYTQYKPATEVPDNLYGEEVAVADTVDNIGNLSWQEIFTDPRLQELIEQGLRNNTDLQSAQWRVKEAEAAMLSAKLAYLPSFALSPQGTASSFDKGKAVQTYTLPVAASWEIDIFGRIRNAKRQAKALLEQSRDYKQAVRTQLIAGIANTYYTLLMLDNQLAISVRTEKSWKETVDATRALMEAGLANEAAVSQMEATYYTICTSVLDLKEQINQVENSLSLLLAESPHAIERTGTWDSSYMMKEHFPVGIPVQMLANRPDVRSAVDFVPIIKQEIVAILPPGHPLTLKDTMEATDFADYPVLGYARHSGLGKYTRSFFKKHDVSPSFICESPDENGIASLVAQGFGIALVADVDAIHRDDICIRHLVSHESFSHTVYMGYMTGKYQLPAIKRFIEFVRKSCS